MVEKAVVSDKKPKAQKSSRTILKIPILIAALVIILIVVIVSVVNKINEPSKEVLSKQACNILTEAIAKDVLSAESVNRSTSTNQPSIKNVHVTKCSYRPSDDGGNKYEVSLVARAPTNSDGVAANKKYFDSPKYASAEKLKLAEKYGTASTWDDTKGELNILKGNTWYTLSYGQVDASTGADKKLADAQRVAEQIKSKL